MFKKKNPKLSLIKKKFFFSSGEEESIHDFKARVGGPGAHLLPGSLVWLLAAEKGGGGGSKSQEPVQRLLCRLSEGPRVVGTKGKRNDKGEGQVKAKDSLVPYLIGNAERLNGGEKEVNGEGPKEGGEEGEEEGRGRREGRGPREKKMKGVAETRRVRGREGGKEEILETQTSTSRSPA